MREICGLQKPHAVLELPKFFRSQVFVDPIPMGSNFLHLVTFEHGV